MILIVHYFANLLHCFSFTGSEQISWASAAYFDSCGGERLPRRDEWRTVLKLGQEVILVCLGKEVAMIFFIEVM